MGDSDRFGAPLNREKYHYERQAVRSVLLAFLERGRQGCGQRHGSLYHRLGREWTNPHYCRDHDHANLSG